MRRFRGRGIAGVGGVLALLALALGAPAGAGQPAGPHVVTSGLNGPFGVRFHQGNLYTAEIEAGQVTEVNPTTGAKTVVASGLEGPDSVDKIGGELAIVTGEGDSTDPATTDAMSLFAARPGHKPKLVADLLDYELHHNVDGQLQFDPTTHQPLDSLSNPFSVIAQRGAGWVLVADAGANAVYSVKRNGEVTPFFVPSVITTGLCHGLQNNDPEHAGCDPVPTGLAYGPNNTLYVSALGALVPGAGRVYVLNATTGKLLRTIEDLASPSGVAVAPNGDVFVSEVTWGAPPEEGPPPMNFDPASIGRLVKIAPNNVRTTAQVTMPTGLSYKSGTLYSTAWSVAGLFFGIHDAGQIVSVKASDFK